MALTSVSFSWRRRSLVVSRMARVMFGREFISIISRNLSSIQSALRDVNRNSGRNPYPEISVKNYMSDKIDDAVGFINWLGVSDIPLRLAEPVAPLFDFRNLALCDYLPWPAVDRRLG